MRVVEIETRHRQQRQADAERDDDLPQHLVARPQTVVRAPYDLQVVVGEADRAEAGRGDHRDPDVRVGEIGPEQCRDQRRRQDQQAAHRRRPGLGAVGLRPVLADHLADLELAQAADHDRPEHDAEQERRHARAGGAERDVAEDVEDRRRAVQRIEKVVEHQANSTFRRSMTVSMRTPCDPLTSTRSPGRTRRSASSAASALVGT